MPWVNGVWLNEDGTDPLAGRLRSPIPHAPTSPPTQEQLLYEQQIDEEVYQLHQNRLDHDHNMQSQQPWPSETNGPDYPDSYYQDMVADDYHAPWFNREEYHRINGPEVPRYSDGSLSPNAPGQDIDFEEVDVTGWDLPNYDRGANEAREFSLQRQQQRELDANQQWIQKTDPTAVMIDEGPFMNGLNDILLGLPAGASGVGGAMGGMTPLLIGLGLLAASQKPAIGQTQGSKNPRERSISGPKYQEHRKKGTPGQEPLTLAKKSSQKVQTQKAKSEAKKTGSRESAEIDKRVKQAEQSRYRERDPMQYGPKTQKAIKDKQKGKQTSMNQQPPWINAIMNIAAGNFEQGLQELASSYNQQKGDQVNA